MKDEANPIQLAVQFILESDVDWMHPICTVLGLRRPKEAQLQEVDDEALLDFGERVLEDLRRGLHRRPGVQKPWGETYGSTPNEVSIERVQEATKTLRTSWAFWSQSRRQVEQWWQGLDDEARDYIQAFLSGAVVFDQSRLECYTSFLHRLFTSSRAVLLLCMARVTFLLYVAPWGETAPEDYASLRLRAFRVLREASLSWSLLVRKTWSVAYWAKSAFKEMRIQEFYDRRRSVYPEDNIDADEQADSEVTDFMNSERFSSEEKRDLLPFFGAQLAEWELFNDCYTMDYWIWIHDMMGRIVKWYRSINGGKPLQIHVIQDEAEVEVSENDARSCAIQLWPFFFAQKYTFVVYDGDTMRSLKHMVCASKEGAVDSWWPEGMYIHRDQKHHNGIRIKAHSEAILCQDWVNRRVSHCYFRSI